MIFFFSNKPFKGHERSARQILCRQNSALCFLARSPTLRCAGQFGVRLCVVLVSSESDSALCWSVRSSTSRCVSQFWSFGKCYFVTWCCVRQWSLTLCRLVSVESDSAQCWSAWSLTPRSVSQRGV